jgi:prophage regulatory protein
MTLDGGTPREGPARGPHHCKVSWREEVSMPNCMTDPAGIDSRSRRRGAAGRVVAPLFVDLRTTAEMLSLSESGVQKLVRQGDLPAPRKLTQGRVGWLLRELQEWAEQRPVSDLLPPVNAGRRRRPESSDSSEPPRPSERSAST